MQDDTCITQLLKSLRSQSEKITEEVLEIEKLIASHKYRQAFLLISDLNEKKVWITSDDDEKNLEKFWWEHAN